jgi:hypothetical protein
MRNKLYILIISILILLSGLNASVTRLYVGDLDGQFMAGVDSRVNFSVFFIGADVRTLIRKSVMNEDDKVVGFFPDRTDYKTSVGIALDNFEIEYAHTCYHRVISEEDLKFYEGNKNLADTDTITVKFIF